MGKKNNSKNVDTSKSANQKKKDKQAKEAEKKSVKDGGGKMGSSRKNWSANDGPNSESTKGGQPVQQVCMRSPTCTLFRIDL